MSRTEPDLVWKKRTSRDEALALLRAMRIGPVFPRDPDGPPLQGMRGMSRKDAREGKDTKPPFRYGRQRVLRAPDAVTAACLSCSWKASGRHWRPVRRLLAEHVGKKHPRLAEAG